MDDKDLAVGLNTNHAVKQKMMVFTQEAIRAKTFGFLEEIVTSHKDGPKAILDELRYQFCNYTEHREQAASIVGKTKVAWHGKLRPGMKDDMCVAFQLLIYWRTVFKTDKLKYGRYH